MSTKALFILEALFVVFLWSASKVLMKWGVETVPPYFFVAAIQIVSLIVLVSYYALTHHKIKFQPTKHEIIAMILGGIVAYGAANLFIAVGLQYVSAGTAGLIAATNTVFGMALASIFLHERPKLWQYLGIAMVAVGVYTSLLGNVLTGTLLGIGLLVLAEVGFAFNNVVSRIIAVRRQEPTNAFIAVVSNLAGVLVLVPTALVADGIPVTLISGKVWLVIVSVGVIFAVAGLVWNNVLDHLKVVEVSVLTNTMILQVGALSVIFLNEAFNSNQLWGSLLVLLGAFVVDGNILLQHKHKA